MATESTDIYVDRVLENWLARVNANRLWETITPQGHSITAYDINCNLVLVLHYQERSAGWEMFIPPSKKNLIADTLDNAALALGVEGCRGLVEESSEAT